MTKWAAKGIKFQKEIASVYTDVGQLTSIKGPNPEVQIFDALSLDSGVGVPIGLTGHVKGGTVQISGFFDPANAVHKALLSDASSPALANYKTIFPDSGNTTWPYSAVMSSPPSPNADVNQSLKFDATATLNGIPTYP